MTISQKHYKEAFNTFLMDQNFDFALTLVWNRDVSIYVARNDLKHLHARVDRKLCGAKYFKKPVSERARFFFAFEKVSTHLHAHTVWRLAKPEDDAAFKNMFSGLRGEVWTKVVSSGTYLLRPNENNEAMVSYVLKAHHKDSDPLHTGFSDEFLP